MSNTFGDRLQRSFDEFGQLCVGVDPHANLLLEWGLTDSVHGLREFSMRVVEASIGLVPAIKPQVSFFERFGSKGYVVLEELTQFAKSEGLLVVADAKRGDIGTTMDAYLDAWFGETSGLYADALTVSPFLGLSSISTPMTKWLAEGKGIYSLVATSNPEGASVQLAKVQDRTLSSSQMAQLEALNESSTGFGSFGAVIGATLDLDKFGIAKAKGNTPILAPGFGAQGAKLTDAKAIYGARAGQVAYSVSRSILGVGPRELASAIGSANRDLKSAFAD